ncbi:MAG TPA: tetratricopeptide repeat protein [Candidatus Saccharimonadales bacterium]|nr:tetratricopeptide repeat protein [Candidatus Saccharimonadales bacterium]
MRAVIGRNLVAVLFAFVAFAACSQKVAPPEVPKTIVEFSIESLIRTSRQAVVQSDLSGAAWGRLGEAFHTADFFEQAESCYRKALELDPQNAKWPHLLGLVQLQEQPLLAISNLYRAVSLESGGKTDASRVHLARALIEQGRFADAENQLQQLFRANSNHVIARLEMARIDLSKGQVAEAGLLLEPCLTNYFTARAAHHLMAQVKLRQGDPASASSLAAEAARIPRAFDWPDPYLREVQGLRLDRQKLQDQANAFLMRQRFKEAEAVLNQLFKASPDDPEGLLLLGRLRFQQRQCGDSEAALRRYLQLQPVSVNGQLQLSLSLLCQERWADAVAQLQGVLNLKPDFGQAYYNLGYALSRLGKSDEAIKNYRQALKCNPGDAQTYVALAEEFYGQKQTTEAIRHLNQALELDPDNASAKKLRARLQQQ